MIVNATTRIANTGASRITVADILVYPTSGIYQRRHMSELTDLDAKHLLGLPLYRQRLMDKPSLESDCCIFCGKPATEDHHIVPRSSLIKKLQKFSPTVSVCGFGNTDGCHGALHNGRIHIRWNERFEYATFEHSVSHDFAEKYGYWEELKVRNYEL